MLTSPSRKVSRFSARKSMLMALLLKRFALLLVAATLSLLLVANAGAQSCVSTISSSYTLLPFNPTFSITPSQIRAGSGQTVVGTLVLDAPAALFSTPQRRYLAWL